MSKNLEIKARFEDLERAARIAKDAGGTFSGTLTQIDTYFHAPRGRLKLRENDIALANGERRVQAELIPYIRPSETGTRTSEYHVVPVADPASCLAGLSAVLGVRVIVRKKRDLWMVGATRVHLDEVEDLGTFIELETVMTTQGDEEGRREHDHLARLLGISKEAAIAGSYSELLLERFIESQ